MSQRTVQIDVPAVDVVPIVNVLYVPLILTSAPAQAAYRDDAKDNGASYREGTVSNGYGRCYGGEITVQRGTWGKMVLDFEVNALSEDTFNAFKRDAQQYLATDKWEYLEEHYSGSGRIGGWFLGCFGGLYAGGRYDHYKNRRDSYRSSGSQSEEGFARTLHNIDNSRLRMQTELYATGQSYIPVRATAYIHLTQIQFADGKTLTAVDTDNPVAATPSGDTTGVTSQPGKLNVIKL